MAESSQICPGNSLYYDDSRPFPLAFLNATKPQPLQSLRNPENEARNLCTHWAISQATPRTVTLLGVTSFYLIREILAQLPANSSLIVAENSPTALNKFLAAHDQESLESYGSQLTFIADEDPLALANLFRRTINQHETFCDGIFIAPASLRFRPVLAQIREQFQTHVRLEAMDRITTASFADEWLQNCLINLPEIVTSPGIKDFAGSLRNTDVFILCAGPGLNDSLEEIKKNQDNCLIIAVGTALKPALSAGIEPHLTIVVDSDPKVFKQFLDVENPPGHFIGTYTVFPALYQLYQSRTISFNCIISQTYADWLDGADVNHGLLNVGGTVAVSAIDCALKLGARNIFVFGLDLSVSEDGTSHAKNSMYKRTKIKSGLTEVQGNRQKTVKTTKQFANYIEILNNYFRDVFTHYTGKIFNVNNGGARFQHMELIRPQEIHDYIQPAGDNFQNLFAHKSATVNGSHLEQYINNSCTELTALKEEADNLLQKMSDDSIPKEVESFENRVKNSAVCSQLLGPALQAWCMSLQVQDNPSPYKMTKSFLEQISGAAEWVGSLLTNSHKRFLKKTQGVKHGT